MLTLIDSFQFLSFSLESLVRNLNKDLSVRVKNFLITY